MLAESKDRVNKERTLRRRQLKGLWQRPGELKQMKLKRDELLKKLGAALHEYPAGARLIHTRVAEKEAALGFTLRKDKLRQARQREGRYLLRSNITRGRSGAELWQFYLQLTEVEAAFFISFLAYGLQVTLRRRLRDLAPGLTPRCVLEKFGMLRMLDVHLPTADERTVVLSRYTQPGTDGQLLLERMKLELPAQRPPKITAPQPTGPTSL